MSQSYKVSVIIPLYNAEKTICECVESVLNQTIDNIQIVLVDDGSVDSSAMLIDQYNILKNVVVIHQENAGVSAARNRGLNASEGKYVFFLDSDDLLDGNVIERLWEFSEEHELDMTACSHTEYNSTIYGGNDSSKNSFIAKTDADISMHFMDVFPKSACAKLFRKSVLDQYGIQFPVGMNLGEDMFFSFSYILKLSSMGKVGDVFYRVQNVNPVSLSKRYVPNLANDIEEQIGLWNMLIRKYPDIETSFYVENYDMEVGLSAAYFNNLYKNDCPLTFRDKRHAMKAYLIRYGNTIQNGAKGIKSPKNRMQKITTAIIKTQSPLLIGLFFMTKEFLKKRKFERGNK